MLILKLITLIDTQLVLCRVHSMVEEFHVGNNEIGDTIQKWILLLLHCLLPLEFKRRDNQAGYKRKDSEFLQP